MSMPLTYPGVYVEELPSGVRTIAGVPTSVAAFVGPAASGPVNEPETLFSFADFTNQFGGLDVGCPMSYAVRDFFANGGGHALVVRIVGAGATSSTFTIASTGGGAGGSIVKLTAASQGNWAHGLWVQINQDGLGSGTEPATKFPPLTTNTQLFNLKVGRSRDAASNVADIVEELRNLSLDKTCSRYIERVLATESRFLTVAASADISASDPASLSTAAVQGTTADDGAAKLVKEDYFPASGKAGVLALDKADIFNFLCLPVKPDADLPSSKELLADAASYCAKRRAMLIMDPPADWTNTGALSGMDVSKYVRGPAARNVAVFYPRLRQANPLKGGLVEEFAPCGAIAGIFAATDSARGVWKAPAGVDAAISGIDSLSRSLNDDENGVLNPLGINCLRTFPVIGTVVWGARTARGADQLSDEYKYTPVRRTALYIEESLYRGTKWVVFEPNDDRLWSQIRLNVGAFMHDLFRQGAFQGRSAQEAYLVKCDRETTLQSDIDRGIVNVLVAFAPLKPAEFVVIQLQQMAGQVAV